MKQGHREKTPKVKKRTFIGAQRKKKRNTGRQGNDDGSREDERSTVTGESPSTAKRGGVEEQKTARLHEQRNCNAQGIF